MKRNTGTNSKNQIFRVNRKAVQPTVVFVIAEDAYFAKLMCNSFYGYADSTARKIPFITGILASNSNCNKIKSSKLNKNAW